MALVIASQCAAAPSLSFLPALAQELAEVLTDPELGDCEPALGAGPVLLDLPRADLIEAVRASFGRANADRDGAVLVLAFIGHGIAADEDFYFLPVDGSGVGHYDADVFLSQLLKECLRDHPNLAGLLVLLDTCQAGVAAAQAATWQQVGLGRRAHRYELLTSSADRPAYGGVVTRAIIRTLREGIGTAGTTIGSRHLLPFLRAAAPGQRPQRITHDGGVWTRPDDAGLWWAHNRGDPARRPARGAPPGSSVPARSAYLLQVARIAPLELLGREEELAELAAFCTAADGRPYRYWLAGPWAGKSALMSWFVNHPPAGVRVVSFFITARSAGQSDRNAFTEVVVEQLAELLGEPMPVLTEATREYRFLDLLARAGDHCRDHGERLILLVDGLDEDSGVTAGPRSHSIAALLPERPRHGVRIIVAGRPNPPIPDDVPRGHPLYDPAAIRPLAPSARAEVAQVDMERELSRLLSGSPGERDLLGLLTAAGGGLSARDLAELTGRLGWQVEEDLATVAGRSFASHSSQWRPGEEPDVYVLGHEELRTTAIARIGPQGLDDYRLRLHAWADSHRQHGWPSTTPEYLLRGYYRMLAADLDVSRMLACATDLARQRRMLDITGGEAEALAEVTALQALLVDEDRLDLAAMGRLSVHRETITDRNDVLPPELPALWAVLGRPIRAEALARSITSEFWQGDALVALAAALAQTGAVDRAEGVVSSISDPDERVEAWGAVALALARRGAVDEAESAAREALAVADEADSPDWPQRAVATVAEALARTGAVDRAEDLLRSVDVGEQAQAWMAVAEALTQTGALDRAEDLVRSIDDAEVRSAASVAVVEALAQAGALDRAEDLARLAVDPGPRALLLAGIARGLTRSGAVDRATAVLRRADAAARSMTTPDGQAQVFAVLACGLAHAGAPDQADAMFQQAESIARSTPDAVWQELVLCTVAALLAEAHDPFDVFTRRAGTVATSSGSAGGEQRALVAVTQGVVRSGRLDRAESFARSITDLSTRAEALVIVARALAETGVRARAEDLAQQAESTARSTSDPDDQARKLTAVAHALARTGAVGRAQVVARRAEAAADAIRLDHWRTARAAVALAAVAEVLARIEVLDPAAVVADRAETIAFSYGSPYEQATALVAVARTWAEIGARERAEAVAGHAETAARAVVGHHAQPQLRSTVLAEVAQVLALAGAVDRAEAVAREAEADARSIVAEPFWQGLGLVPTAQALAEAGAFERAEAVARSIGHPEVQAKALVAVAQVLTRAGARERAGVLARAAETAARSITDPDRQAEGMAAIVRALAGTGALDTAEALTAEIEPAARSIENPNSQAEALMALAAGVGPDHARRLVRAALQVGHWWDCLGAVVTVEPTAIAALADEYESIATTTETLP